jgi:hypothetical protein
MVRGSNPGGGEIFRTCPDRPWGPPSLLYNGYLVFPGGKVRPGRDADPHPLLLPRSKIEYSYTSTLPKGLCGLWKGESYLDQDRLGNCNKRAVPSRTHEVYFLLHEFLVLRMGMTVWWSHPPASLLLQKLGQKQVPKQLITRNGLAWIGTEPSTCVAEIVALGGCIYVRVKKQLLLCKPYSHMAERRCGSTYS